MCKIHPPSDKSENGYIQLAASAFYNSSLQASIQIGPVVSDEKKIHWFANSQILFFKGLNTLFQMIKF